MESIAHIAVITALCLSATSASAQRFSETSYGARDVRLGVGLTVPLGGSERTRQAPRVELAIARDHISANGERQSLRIGAPQPLRLGLSIERQSRVMVNGRAVRGVSDNRRNLSTWGAIGIGAIVLAGAYVALWQYADAQSE
ncbi:MAG: hypothetical protein ABL882_08985 [Sphingopyxis sp.]